MKKITWLLYFFTSFVFSQTFISNMQSYYDVEKSETIYIKDKRIISINEPNFSVELPDNSELKGTLTFWEEKIKDGFKVKSYKIDGGGVIAVFKDNVFFNLHATQDIAYSFYLDNFIEPTEAEKKKEKEERNKKVAESIYQTHIKMFGRLTADCIRNVRVRPGMKEVALPLVLGHPNSINTTETLYSTTKQYVYDNKFVYVEKGIVTSIQTHQ